ncbi:hypothetical protein PC41400_00700 [Paenibacillus chitinolyticus]|uniref:Uncharacterized protein n=1 Tax=Paenibacillus chitinolyticus TaxID=79263 RepID=A0A410WPR0_9BACL|nr:hypothetical protein [Paenibacillus chitinolyticus]MCY9590851.1 hypothetical protein [Paenibacillus chitinolyticus]MCY9598758.1 hypothetical protein [Paenibacillus chitinolyticus]QAV16297.1 hypothetical protein PC41400_00700 [Paenibacillus chitinolyticus]
MLKKMLTKLLGSDKNKGSHYRPHSSSDDFRRHSRKHYNGHNHYGHNHYKKKRSSSSYSS